MDETPTKLFLETSLPTSASPYPSPSSAFYPPPIPASHEFANKLGTSLVGNKRYRGSGGSHHSAGGAGGGNGNSASTGGGGLSSPTSAQNGLGPSSANSSRRGSASAPSPLATHPPHVALDGIVGSPSTVDDASTPSHDRMTGMEGIDANRTIDPRTPLNPSQTSSASDQNANANTTSLNPAIPANSSTPTASACPSTPPPTTNNPSTTPTSTYPSTSTYPNPINPASNPVNPTSNPVTPAPTSKRASQILESLTPIRAAPPSPGPSRRGSLIRRGSSRRWSRGSGALGAGSGGVGSTSGGDAGGLNSLIGAASGIGGMAGIGSAWFGADTTGGTSSTVSEDGSLHSNSGEPGSTSTDATTTTTSSNNPAAASSSSNAAAASKRASRRLSAFAALAALASTAEGEGEVVSFHDLVAKEDEGEDEGGYLDPSAPSPSVVETETEPVTPATPTDDAEAKTETTPSNIAAEATTIAPTPSESGFSPLKPILVADFAYPLEDARHSKRPLELLSKIERDALSPEEMSAYSKGKGKDEWEEGAEEDGEDQWGWIGVTGLRPRRKREGGGYDDEEGDDGEGEEMTPRFGYGYSYEASTPTDGSSNTQNGGSYNSGSYDSTNTGRVGEGGGQGEKGEFDPDSPLPPGIYRALYAFEAEGTAEMSLSEGQLVRVVGRGGGVGWAVVERGWRPENSGSAVPGAGAGADSIGDTGAIAGGGEEKDAGMGTGEESSGALGLAGQALVPEGYLEIWMLDGEEWGGRDGDDF